MKSMYKQKLVQRHDVVIFQVVWLGVVGRRTESHGYPGLSQLSVMYQDMPLVHEDSQGWYYWLRSKVIFRIEAYQKALGRTRIQMVTKLPACMRRDA